MTLPHRGTQNKRLEGKCGSSLVEIAILNPEAKDCCPSLGVGKVRMHPIGFSVKITAFDRWVLAMRPIKSDQGGSQTNGNLYNGSIQAYEGEIKAVGDDQSVYTKSLKAWLFTTRHSRCLVPDNSKKCINCGVSDCLLGSPRALCAGWAFVRQQRSGTR
uniref:DUF4283 domain-containing protein n=1 Tax=Steinernema glaseri TaxID=37863 RepID=A0A1I8A015_9BILA